MAMTERFHPKEQAGENNSKKPTRPPQQVRPQALLNQQKRVPFGVAQAGNFAVETQ